MLIKNIWQGKGLYNGALGTVQGFVFSDNVKPPSLPLCVLVEFDDYKGPSAAGQGQSIVPIIAETIQFDPKSRKTGSRRQIPLILGWSITIHKSQGLTVPNVRIGIGSNETHNGITYVGLSRVKSVHRLAFESSFPWERMEKINKSKGLELVKIEIARLLSLEDRCN